MRWSWIASLAAVPIISAWDVQLPLGKSGQVNGDDAPSYRDSLLELHKELVTIKSVSGQEQKVGDFLKDYLTSKGFSTQLQQVKSIDNTPENEKRFNLIAWPGSSKTPKAKVVLSSHIDVVPPHIDYGIEDGPITKETIVKGRGTADAKGSVAAMIIALEELLAAGKVHGDSVMFVLVVGEEIAGDGMVQFSRYIEDLPHRPSFDSVIFGEPTENKLVCGHKGGLFCDLTAKGIASHSGYPWLGKSANELMIQAWSKILATDLGSTELYGNTTINVGLFQGGVASNVVPEHAMVKFAARVAIGPEDGGQKIVKEKIEKILNEVDPEAFEMDCAEGYGSVDCNCDVDGEFVRRVDRRCTNGR